MNILLVARAGVMREAVLRGSSRTKKWFPEPSIKSTFSFASSDQCFANCHGDPRYVYAHPSMLVGYDTLYLKWPTNRIDRFSDHILSASTTSHDEHLDRQGNQPGPLIAKRYRKQVWKLGSRCTKSPPPFESICGWVLRRRALRQDWLQRSLNWRES